VKAGYVEFPLIFEIITTRIRIWNEWSPRVPLSRHIDLARGQVARTRGTSLGTGSPPLSHTLDQPLGMCRTR